MRTKQSIKRALSKLEQKFQTEKQICIMMIDEGNDLLSSSVILQATKAKMKGLEWVLDDVPTYPDRGNEWVGGKESKKSIRIFHLVDSELHKKYQDDPNNPDYYRGMEDEPYALWIIESGFKDLFHTIIESPEFEQGVYEMLTTQQTKDKFGIEV